MTPPGLPDRPWQARLPRELRLAFLIVNEPVPVGRDDVDMLFMDTPEFYPAKYSKFDTVLAPGRCDFGTGFIIGCPIYRVRCRTAAFHVPEKGMN